MPTIVHFEIPSDDTERSKKFYNELFGWKIEKWPGSEDMPEATGYWMVTTVDDKGNEGSYWRYDEKTDAATARNYNFLT